MPSRRSRSSSSTTARARSRTRTTARRSARCGAEAGRGAAGARLGPEIGKTPADCPNGPFRVQHRGRPPGAGTSGRPAKLVSGGSAQKDNPRRTRSRHRRAGGGSAARPRSRVTGQQATLDGKIYVAPHQIAGGEAEGGRSSRARSRPRPTRSRRSRATSSSLTAEVTVLEAELAEHRARLAGARGEVRTPDPPSRSSCAATTRRRSEILDRRLVELYETGDGRQRRDPPSGRRASRS